MEQVGSGAYLLVQVLHESFSFFDPFGKLSRVALDVPGEVSKAHAQCGQCLARTVVQFPRQVPPLYILGFHQPYSKVLQFGVSPLKFLSAKLHLNIERIGECSITFFALKQRSRDQ